MLYTHGNFSLHPTILSEYFKSLADEVVEKVEGSGRELIVEGHRFPGAFTSFPPMILQVVVV